MQVTQVTQVTQTLHFIRFRAGNDDELILNANMTQIAGLVTRRAKTRDGHTIPMVGETRLVITTLETAPVAVNRQAASATVTRVVSQKDTQRVWEWLCACVAYLTAGAPSNNGAQERNNA